ncbi:MAG: S9 family peptidase [Planctomycetes bacterium]|nr:S9 family peptidase [Planctomycetota bacterium]
MVPTGGVKWMVFAAFARRERPRASGGGILGYTYGVGSADDPEQFRYLHAYSPYHRVQPGTEYPAVLFITGDSDTRVAPLHARKMCALLQSANGSERPILLRYDTKAGHSRAKPVSKQIEDTADVLSFLFSQLDVDLETTSHERVGSAVSSKHKEIEIKSN